MTGGKKLAATTPGRGLTIPQRLLRAAASLPQPFHETDLILCSWRDSPALFGLRGREAEHPDANRARCAVQGSKGLVARGWLERTRDYHYRLTRLGLAEATRLVESNGTAKPAPLPRVAVPPDLDGYLTGRFESEAYRQFVCGRVGGRGPIACPPGRTPLTAADVLAFWDCTPGDSAATVRAARDTLARRLGEAAVYAGVPLACGCEVSDELLDRLGRCSAALAAHWRHLGVA